ncbi:hypothetical protein GCM10022402_47000 [Salinactinospora qingdaonensis]|uniref:Uncharacterized protein n=1 Tax=Salinactinospora qingdaonensis TaxID=702744 RepID=A0ABP7GFV0_9ACTN
MRRAVLVESGVTISSGAWLARRTCVPPAKGEHNVLQFVSIAGEFVDHRRGRSGPYSALHDPAVFEFLESCREDAGGDSRQAVAQVGEAFGAYCQVTDNE